MAWGEYNEETKQPFLGQTNRALDYDPQTEEDAAAPQSPSTTPIFRHTGYLFTLVHIVAFALYTSIFLYFIRDRAVSCESNEALIYCMRLCSCLKLENSAKG